MNYSGDHCTIKNETRNPLMNLRKANCTVQLLTNTNNEIAFHIIFVVIRESILSLIVDIYCVQFHGKL